MIRKKSNIIPLNPRTYISLFSSAGIGCYGFKMENYYCVATCEILERRLKIQSYNHKCVYEEGYIGDDITKEETKERISKELEFWKLNHGVRELDVLIATPPCQGMSVANHKKTNEDRELKRNSLVVESLKMVMQFNPKFFIIENVRSFLTTGCVDVDNVYKPIKEAIYYNLGGRYNIYARVINFKEYGNPSSRPRTLVIGVRKDLKGINPFQIFPDRQPEKKLKDVIGDLPSLKTMGVFWEKDLYHGFKSYDKRMEAWIAPLKEGESAFDNKDPNLRPHKVVDGVIIPNANKNGDKYTRQCWNKVAPCIHTRNDIMASQNTVHPKDNRVFSIRELMRMMSVPDTFQWSHKTFDELNSMSDEEKRMFLKKEEMNIRQNLGEAVPTVIFKQIAHKINNVLDYKTLKEQEINKIINEQGLFDYKKLIQFIKSNIKLGFVNLSKIAELANHSRFTDAAYYTDQDICFSVVKHLPDYPDSASLHILEPSVGLGNFLPSLFVKYANVARVNLDVFDINDLSLNVLRELLKCLTVPSNFSINIINADTLLYDFDTRYDIAVGNPPYMKLSSDKKILDKYKAISENTITNNLFSFFIEKCSSISDIVSLIVPKSLINAPEFDKTRNRLNRSRIDYIVDYGEKAFKGVKIETISFVLYTKEKPSVTNIESYITNELTKKDQSYITEEKYPYWLIYRNSEFDSIASNMTFDIFTAYRDRAITKKHTLQKGKIRVLKSKNIGSNCVVDIDGYDCYIDDITPFGVSKYLNAENCYCVPNLSYNPRACRLPKNCIADGSVAILEAKSNVTISDDDLAFFDTKEFHEFYMIARNKGTRSLNIDNNSVFFFGIKK